MKNVDNFLTQQRKTNTKPEIAFFNQFPLNAMIHILTVMKFYIAPIQLVFKWDNGHFVSFFDAIIIIITEIPRIVEVTENANLF